MLLTSSPGCAKRGVLPSDSAQALAAIKDWVPFELPVAKAIRIMEDHGFRCTRSKDARSSREFLYCFADDGRPLVKRRWQATFEIANEKVISQMVTIDLVGP